jgi:energy-coupling factor transporter ATP-binding protein EcfA2
MKRIIIVLSQLALLGSVALTWEQVKARPITAILGGILCELIIAIFAFSGKVWAKVESVVVQSAADWILSTINSFAPGFHRRYNKQIINDHGVFNVLGLGLINTYKLALEHVFVDLRINPSNPQNFNENLIADINLSGNRPIWDFLRSKKLMISNGTALAIVGPPGSGKTTLLQHIAITFAANKQRHHRIRSYIPVLLFLRNHISTIAGEKPPSLGRLIQGYFGDRDVFPTLKTPSGWYEKKLYKGKCIVLLDGLDEVADLQQRKLISAWVDNQIKNYPRSSFVITSRPQGYRGAPLQRAHVLEVQPFNASQVRSFIENWYFANEILEHSEHDSKLARKTAKARADDLLQRLRELPAIRALTVNPLLLTMITMVHNYRHALPGSRVELYAEIFEVLLGRWRHAKGVKETFKAEQKLAVVVPLAAYMTENKLTEIDTETATRIIGKLLKQVGASGLKTQDFLSDVQSGSGILLEREAGRWGFAHLSFQEYLTAVNWLRQKSINYKWEDQIGDSWWNETLRWYAAQGDATPVVRACLQNKSGSALTLVVNCLDEAHELDEEVRLSAQAYLVDALESSNTDHRHIAAEVQLSRRLETIQPITGEQFIIDTNYITCAEYQLFIDEMVTHGKHYHPDHWTTPIFRSGEALKPVSGIRAEDANAFCDWLTKRKGGAVRYRLPRPDEAQQSKAKMGELATWSYSDEKFSLEGLGELNKNILVDQLTKLSDLPLPSLDILKIELSKAIQHSFAMARALMISQGVGLDLDLARRVSRSIIRDMDRDIAFLRCVAPISITNQSATHFFAMAPVYSRAHRFDSAIHDAQMVGLINATVNAGTVAAMRQTHRRYIAYVLQHAYKGYKRMKHFDFTTPSQRQHESIQWSVRQLDPESDFLKFYWWLEIVLAREAGELPPWEGIRVVCETT